MPQPPRFSIEIIDNLTNTRYTVYAYTFIAAQFRASKHLIDSNTYAIIEEITQS